MYGECAGSILVDIQGGIAPYSLTLTLYTESGSTIIQNIESVNSSEMPYAFESLYAGNYSISAFDSNASIEFNGCNSFVADIIIEQPLQLKFLLNLFLPFMNVISMFHVIMEPTDL